MSKYKMLFSLVAISACASVASAQWTTSGSTVHPTDTSKNVAVGVTTADTVLHVRRDQDAATVVKVQNANPGSTSANALSGFDFFAGTTHVRMLAVGSGNYVAYGGPGTLQMWNFGANGNGGPIVFGNGAVERMRITAEGKLLIGTTTAGTEMLKVAGDVNVTGNIAAKYQDLAEWVPSTEELEPGSVVVIDPAGTDRVIASSIAYDTTVAGVVSAQPGIILGERGESKEMVATTGRVRVLVDATAAPIRIGDLLVTSSKPGRAMKSIPMALGTGSAIHRPGTILGKALEALDSGEGEILVLLSLQ